MSRKLSNSEILEPNVGQIQTSSPIPVWLSGWSGDLQNVITFSQEHDLLHETKMAVELADECFPEATVRKIFLESDTEDGSEPVVIELVTPLKVKDAVQAYRVYVEKWVAAIPYPQRNMFRFAYYPS